jgi:uncharacterized membrane protein YqjE
MKPGDDGPDVGLLGRLRRIGATAFELARLRVEILATDVELGALRFFDALLLALAALLALAVGLVLLCAWILLMVQPEYRLQALAVLALVLLVGGGLALAAARGRLRQAGAAFQATRAELARDVAVFGPDRPGAP